MIYFRQREKKVSENFQYTKTGREEKKFYAKFFHLCVCILCVYHIKHREKTLPSTLILIIHETEKLKLQIIEISSISEF